MRCNQHSRQSNFQLSLGLSFTNLEGGRGLTLYNQIAGIDLTHFPEDKNPTVIGALKYRQFLLVCACVHVCVEIISDILVDRNIDT